MLYGLLDISEVQEAPKGSACEAQMRFRQTTSRINMATEDVLLSMCCLRYAAVDVATWLPMLWMCCCGCCRCADVTGLEVHMLLLSLFWLCWPSTFMTHEGPIKSTRGPVQGPRMHRPAQAWRTQRGRLKQASRDSRSAHRLPWFPCSWGGPDTPRGACVP